MDIWILALILTLVCALIAALLLPFRVHLSAQGRGDPSGAWAVAGGAQLGPVILSAVAGRGVGPKLELRLFRRVIWQKRPAEAHAAASTGGAPGRGERASRRSLSADYSRLARWFDPVELGLFLVRERRRIRVEQLELEVAYSFEDPTLTGKLMGAIYMLSGVLPSEVVLRQAVSWEFVDRGSFSLAGRVVVFPGLLLVDTALFVLRNVRIRKRPRAVRGT